MALRAGVDVGCPRAGRRGVGRGRHIIIFGILQCKR